MLIKVHSAMPVIPPNMILNQNLYGSVTVKALTKLEIFIIYFEYMAWNLSQGGRCYCQCCGRVLLQ